MSPRLRALCGVALRFLGSGGVCTAVDFIIYMALGKLGLATGFEKTISTTAACVLGFFINRAWTFRYQGETGVRIPLKYAAAQLCNIGVNTLVNRAVRALGGGMILAFIAATGCGMVVNFILQKFWVFKEKQA